MRQLGLCVLVFLCLCGVASGGSPFGPQAMPGTSADGVLVNLGTNNDVTVGATVIKEVVFTLDTDPYADGDVLADTQEITAAVRANGAGAILQNITCIDADDQGIAFDVLILQTNVSIGTENAALSISDVNATEILARIPIQVGNSYDIGGADVWHESNLARAVQAAAGSTSLFIALVSRGAGTYTANGITCQLGLIQD